MLLPGWRLTGRTIGMMLGRGPEHRIFLGTWGSTIILGGDGSVLNDLTLRLSSKKHRPDGLGVWSMWASTVVNSVEFFVRAPGWDRYVCTECNDYFGADEDDSGDFFDKILRRHLGTLFDSSAIHLSCSLAT